VDALNALATLIVAKIKEGIYAAWLKFLFELVFSAVVTYLFTAGTILAGTELTGALPALPAADLDLIARGAGMVAAAVSLTAVFRKEAGRLTKGMFVVLPSEEAAKEIATNLQVIEKPGEKK
jgi:hypothetical protein